MTPKMNLTQLRQLLEETQARLELAQEYASKAFEQHDVDAFSLHQTLMLRAQRDVETIRTQIEIYERGGFDVYYKPH
jgi:hypothetical protein